MIPLRIFLNRLVIAASFCCTLAHPADQPDRFQKPTIDDETKYTSVGNIGLTITNFGTIGTRNNKWPTQPSCEYPRGSRIEHIYQGALWVGALVKTQRFSDPRNNQFLVSTGASDRASSSSRIGEGYEYNSEGNESITERSSLVEDRQFNPLAVSHQDFICTYVDTFTRVPSTGDSILNHQPLGIKVYQESYAWNFPFADNFAILRYMIVNVSADTLDSVYVGFWDNAVVRNTNNTQPRTVGYFDHGAHGYNDSLRMVYSFDWDGIPGGPPASSYIGLKLLGTTPFPSGVDSLGNLNRHTYFNAWRFRSSVGDEAYFSPDQDGGTGYKSRYVRMSQSIPQNYIDALRKSPTAPGNFTYLLSTGPFSRLNPKDTVEVVFSVICARKYGSAPANNDTWVQRKNLDVGARWAQQSYNGEDANGNNKLDPGEDIARRDSVSRTELGLRYEPDWKITRYLLPTPPRKPKARAEVENQTVVIYWDSLSAEGSKDPISGKYDFEGYRIYRSESGSDFLNHQDFLLNLSLVGEFDKKDDNIGYNTGFDAIKLKIPKKFDDGDTVEYLYRFPPVSDQGKPLDIKHLNGWQYLYGISSFDEGDSANNILSLESAKALLRVIPGTPPASGAVKSVGVYPNPYCVNAFWDGNRERLRKIYFYNLPAHCEIRIYTLAGDVVTVLNHDASTYNGSNIEWFNEYGDRGTPVQFAGGEHAWDLISKNDQAIATGLYLFTVEDKDTDKIVRGKFLIIK